MRTSELVPRVHLFVCTNFRAAGSPLGPGCAAAGEALYDALKREVASHGDTARVWVTKTACMGICPAHGAACARYPSQIILSEAEAGDAKAIYASLEGEES